MCSSLMSRSRNLLMGVLEVGVAGHPAGITNGVIACTAKHVRPIQDVVLHAYVASCAYAQAQLLIKRESCDRVLYAPLP